MEEERNVEAIRIVRGMDEAWAKGDIEALVAFFAENATIESPLVCRIFQRTEGICRGREEIRRLLSALVDQGRPWGTHEPPIVGGKSVVVEYRPKAPSSDAEHVSVDVLELRAGKVQSLRAYLGWRALADHAGGRG